MLSASSAHPMCHLSLHSGHCLELSGSVTELATAWQLSLFHTDTHRERICRHTEQSEARICVPLCGRAQLSKLGLRCVPKIFSRIYNNIFLILLFHALLSTDVWVPCILPAVMCAYSAWYLWCLLCYHTTLDTKKPRHQVVWSRIMLTCIIN